ncbi:sodium/potassium/calcium exchanger 5-like [Amphiura filiformis]|uniref:sodium/potassium/calcium exchanger 5-like n=1 Tax=Amphiura filiformis TaxID=82378 RepID=UPI003B21D06A
MTVTYRQLRIAKSCAKILFCVLLFGSYWYMKRGTNFGQADVEKRTDFRENGERWMDPADELGGEKAEIYPDTFMVRHLLETNGNDTNTTCTKRGISSFPTVFTNAQRKKGAILINFLVSFYMCGMIGYCCAAYFVPALEIICTDLNLSPDVAGATFMAAGSSAPEFFSAVIGTFISEDDTGISAIVGSAAFNVFIIIAFCCFLAEQDVKLTWWPLFRDCVIYVLSVLLLVFFMYNGVVEWWEGLILSIGYIFYIILMYFNPILSAKAIAWKNHHAEETDTTSLIKEVHQKQDSYGSSSKYQESDFSEADERHANGTIEKSTEESQRTRERSYTRDAESIPYPFRPPKNTFLRASWILGLPTIVAMYISIPDCRLPRWRKYYMLTFICAVIWLMGTSYILYWMITVIGYTLDIPDTVMGISLLAGGTSVPDLIASVLVVRHGYGDMAISNIIGSNIFEVFVCLGLLWFIKAAFISDVIISSEGLTFTSVVLLLTVAFIVLGIHINGWKLNVGLGVVCTGVYVVFITFAILRELGIIGGGELPTYCPGPI